MSLLLKTLSVEYTVTSNRLVTLSVPDFFPDHLDDDTVEYIIDRIREAEENGESSALDSDRREIVQVYEEGPDWDTMSREGYKEAIKMSEAELFDELPSLFYPAPWLPKEAWDAKPASFTRGIQEAHRYVRAEPKLEAIMEADLPF